MITVQQLGLDINYLKKSEAARKQICVDIIKKAFGKMTVNASYIERINAINTVLQNSIKYCESVENYESAKILFDIQKTLEADAEKLKQEILNG